MPYIAASCEIHVSALVAFRTRMKRPRRSESDSGRGDAILASGDEIGATRIDRWVDLQKVGNVAPGCNAGASVASFRRL